MNITQNDLINNPYLCPAVHEHDPRHFAVSMANQWIREMMSEGLNTKVVENAFAFNLHEHPHA